MSNTRLCQIIYQRIKDWVCHSQLILSAKVKETRTIAFLFQVLFKTSISYDIYLCDYRNNCSRK